MQFPRLMFRTPGPEQCQGGTYAHASVADQAQYDEKLADGWHATLPDALSPPNPPALPPTPPAEPIAEVKELTQATESTPPTRDEMKRKADELGMTYAHNISNIKLAELLDAALAQD